MYYIARLFEILFVHLISIAMHTNRMYIFDNNVTTMNARQFI